MSTYLTSLQFLVFFLLLRFDIFASIFWVKARLSPSSFDLLNSGSFCLMWWLSVFAFIKWLSFGICLFPNCGAWFFWSECPGDTRRRPKVEDFYESCTSSRCIDCYVFSFQGYICNKFKAYYTISYKILY